MSEHLESESAPLIQPSHLSAIEKAQIDSQVATAKKYPRSLAECKKRMLDVVQLDQETAASCFYTLPARAAGTKPIQGPSIRLAEVAVASYTNLAAGARIVEDDGTFVTAQGVCFDMENNTRVTMEVKRRVRDKHGRRYSDDVVGTTMNAACAIAFRNSVFKVIPGALVKPVYQKALEYAVGDKKTLAMRRSKAVEHFNKLGIDNERLFAAINVKGLEEITLDKLGVLLGYHTAISDGDMTLDEAFPEVDKPKSSGLTPPQKKAKAKKPATPAGNGGKEKEVAPTAATEAAPSPTLPEPDPNDAADDEPEPDEPNSSQDEEPELF